MDTFIENLFKTGVVGAGGAGFPTFFKADRKADVVIANGAECEPLLSNDKYIMMNMPDMLLQGLSMLANHTGAKRKVVAIKEKYHQVEQILKPIAKKYDIEIFFLGNTYPAGDEHEIVNYVTGQIVSEMGIPPDVGVITNNVETLVNISYAQEGKPVTHRFMSLVGEVLHPGIYQVPVGTNIKTLVLQAGGATCTNPVYMVGGIMMGKLVEEDDYPLTKTTGAVVVLPTDHKLVQIYRQSYSYSLIKAKSACTQCVLCSEACSRNLLGHRLFPHKIMLLADFGMEEDSWLARSAMLCSECGCCEYACPMGLSPRRVIQVLKNRLRSRGISFEPGKYKPELNTFREARHIPVERIIARYGLSKYQFDIEKSKISLVQPDQVTILLKQHIGAPAKPVVKKGTIIKEGDVIAVMEKDTLGSNFHASINGTITQISEEKIEITV